MYQTAGSAAQQLLQKLRQLTTTILDRTSFLVFLPHESTEWKATVMTYLVKWKLERYPSDSSSDLSSLNAYPHIKELYVLLNTGLPASAAVERLFSLGGRVFSPLRTRLSSEHFEMMVFLHLATWINSDWTIGRTCLNTTYMFNRWLLCPFLYI